MRPEMAGIMEILGRRIAILNGRILLLSGLISYALTLSFCRSDDDEKVPYYRDASFTPVWNPTAEQKAGMHKISSFSFTNQYGESVSNQTFKGKVYLISFFFTSCPSICPKL